MVNSMKTPGAQSAVEASNLAGRYVLNVAASYLTRQVKHEQFVEYVWDVEREY